MEKNQKNSPGNRKNGDSDKVEKNAGSGSFNQGSEQDPDYDATEADTEKDRARLGKEKEDPKSGNIGKNNAGGYE